VSIRTDQSSVSSYLVQRSSQHFKAWPLDTVLAGLTQGQPYRHVMGYELNLCCRFVSCPLSASA
jgi:hypothetical protein